MEMIILNLAKKKVHDGWIVFNKDNNTHAHIRSKKTCNDLMCLLRKNIKPNKPYLIESAKRLLTDNEFNSLRIKRYKQSYTNINKSLQK